MENFISIKVHIGYLHTKKRLMAIRLFNLNATLANSNTLNEFEDHGIEHKMIIVKILNLIS